MAVEVVALLFSKRLPVKWVNSTIKWRATAQYVVQLTETPKKFTRNVRCTNHLMRCRICPQETGVWKYSLLQHFEQFHEGCDLLQEEVLGDDERDHIINNC